MKFKIAPILCAATLIATLLAACAPHQLTESPPSRAGQVFASRAANTNPPVPIGGSGSGSNTNPPGSITPPTTAFNNRVSFSADTNGNLTAPANTLATPAEVTTGTNANKIVSPATLAATLGRSPIERYGATARTDAFYTWGGETNSVDGDLWVFNNTMLIFTNANTTAASKNSIFTNAATAGHYVMTNRLLGMQYSNTVAGPPTQGIWTNTGGGLTKGFLAESLLRPTTNSVFGLNPTNQRYYGLVFYGGIPFGQSNVTRKAYYASVTADGTLVSLGANIPIEGETRNARDTSTSKSYNGYQLMGLTTNRFDGAGSGSPALELKISSGFQPFVHFTNLSFLPASYSSIHPTNLSTWKVTMEDDGEKLWFGAGVSTNNRVSFDMWFRTMSLASFPFGELSEPVKLNQTSYTNLVDGTLLWCKTNMVMAVDDVGGGLYIQLGYFSTTNPASPFIWTLTGDHSVWLGGFEAPFFTRYFTSDGQEVTALNGIKALSDYGGAGDGYMHKIATITNFNPTANTPWSTLTHVNYPRAPNGLGYAQNWIPQQPQTVEELNRMAAMVPATMPLSGTVSLFPEESTLTNVFGITKFGFPAELNAPMPVPGNWVGHTVPGSGMGYWMVSDGKLVLTGMAPPGQTNIVIEAGTNYVRYSHGEIAATTNAITAAQVAGMITNNQAWYGIMSNAFQVARMSNNVVTWKILSP